MPWNEISNKEELLKVLESFVQFKQATVLDIKYFSADRTNPEFPGDTSYENRVYASFVSDNPEIAEDPAICNLVLKFTGIDKVNITANKGDTGALVNGACLALVDGKFIWSSDPDFLDYYSDSLSLEGAPTFIVADALAWIYGFDVIKDE